MIDESNSKVNDIIYLVPTTRGFAAKIGSPARIVKFVDRYSGKDVDIEWITHKDGKVYGHYQSPGGYNVRDFVIESEYLELYAPTPKITKDGKCICGGEFKEIGLYCGIIKSCIECEQVLGHHNGP